jgi:hypothetical protein
VARLFALSDDERELPKVGERIRHLFSASDGAEFRFADPLTRSLRSRAEPVPLVPEILSQRRVAGGIVDLHAKRPSAIHTQGTSTAFSGWT